MTDKPVHDGSKTGFNFEFHYDESTTIGGVLTHILCDLASFKTQRWDNSQQLVKTVAADAHRYLDKVGFGEANELTDHTTIDDVSVLKDHVIRRPVILDSDFPTQNYFFLSRVCGRVKKLPWPLSKLTM